MQYALWYVEELIVSMRRVLWQEGGNDQHNAIVRTGGAQRHGGRSRPIACWDIPQGAS